MMLTFLLAARKYLKLNIILYYIILLALVIGLFFSGSKGFFTGTIIIFSYLIFKTKWREILEFLLILSLVFFLAKSYTNTLIRYYESYFKNTTIITFYNKTLGKRYGEFYEKTEENIKEIENFRKMKLMNSQKEATKENNSNSLGIKETTQAKEKTSEVLPKEKEIKIDGKDYRFNFEDGNLSDALKVVYSHFLIGVGFVSNVNYGDSMVVHLLVRGGIIGICFYLGFLFVISRELYKTSFTDAQSKAFSEAWIVVCIIFLTGGLAYPSFVQDRTGDIFWWLAAILAMKQPSARPSFS
ncbi:MAG: hypothetical protein ACD_79C00742G0003 [uncultured bacterium]|nr:MAG: hypothetical protein ACD_79C00742G0003 [uncultured bacterium]